MKLYHYSQIASFRILQFFDVLLSSLNLTFVDLILRNILYISDLVSLFSFISVFIYTRFNLKFVKDLQTNNFQIKQVCKEKHYFVTSVVKNFGILKY